MVKDKEVIKRTFILILILVLTGIVVPIMGILAPAVATDILDLDLLEVSTRIMFPIGLGAVLGGLATVKLLKNGRKKTVITSGLILGATSLFFLGVIVSNLPNKADFGTIASLFLGIALAMTVIPSQTFLQEHTPEAMRGRVFGVLSFSITVASFLPIMSLAALTEFFGERTILTGLAFVLLFSAVISVNRRLRIKKLYAK